MLARGCKGLLLNSAAGSPGGFIRPAPSRLSYHGNLAWQQAAGSKTARGSCPPSPPTPPVPPPGFTGPSPFYPHCYTNHHHTHPHSFGPWNTTSHSFAISLLLLDF